MAAPLPTLARLRARGDLTVPARALTRDERRAGAVLTAPLDVERPRTRGDCAEGPRPCPWVSCAHHLYLDVNPDSGAIKLNFPDMEVWQMAESCALDVAERGGTTLEDVGGLLGLTKERARQVQFVALARLRRTTERS